MYCISGVQCAFLFLSHTHSLSQLSSYSLKYFSTHTPTECNMTFRVCEISPTTNNLKFPTLTNNLTFKQLEVSYFNKQPNILTRNTNNSSE